ncbi:MAG: type VI secretion system-associated FHA domain protein TagH [Rhizobiaceae bacterium]|nr:type VI secretion system-associated FHA domain protein TagH [Rhizobiaceae bacterium]MCV0405111.1 type VI secretion system-associated FHA domain protein TagH [Rhizobiaceae bacterium]
MTITLRVDNLDSLPDGGPLAFTGHAPSFEVGREAHMDWTLPDPNRVISGRHCEFRFDNGAWWLNDVSRNGTYVNGHNTRVKSPYRVADGDRLQIGHYLISVSVSAEEDDYVPDGTSGQYQAPTSGGDGIWDTGAPAPAPISRRDLMPPPKRARRDADFAEQYLELPQMRSPDGVDPFATPAPPAPPSSPPQAHNPFGAPQADPFPRQPPAPPPHPAHSSYGPGPASEGFAPSPTPLPPSAPAHRPQAGPASYGESEPFAPAPRQAPPPPPAPAYAPPQPPRPAHQPAGDLFARIAAGAGVSPDIFAQRPPDEVAEEIGRVLRIVVVELTQLLKARAAAKVLARSANRTMISAIDNNPLKFVPLPEEALEVMFARRRAGYLDAERSIEESFKDLKTHEFATWAAMQRALGKLLEEFAPETIEKKVSGVALTSRKGRAWDQFVAAWEARSEAGENGMLDAFLVHFADAYEKASKKG